MSVHITKGTQVAEEKKTTNKKPKKKDDPNYVHPNKGRKNPANSKRMRVNMSADEMSLLISHNLELKDLPEIDRNDAGQVAERLHLYFDMCIEHGIKPTVSGMSLALKLTRSELAKICHGQTKKPREVTEIVQEYYQLIDSMMESYMTENKINPVSGIFLMKNNHGYKDQTDVIVTPNNLLGEGKSEEELNKKYLSSVADLPEADAEIVEEK